MSAIWHLATQRIGRSSTRLVTPFGDHIADLAAIGGRWVRVTPHIQAVPAGDVASLQSSVVDACDPAAGTGWCASLPMPALETLAGGASVLAASNGSSCSLLFPPSGRRKSLPPTQIACFFRG